MDAINTGTTCDKQPPEAEKIEAFVAPTPIDDLERRIKILADRNVRAYKDGTLEIVFDRPAQARIPPEVGQFNRFIAAEAAGRGITNG